MHTRTQICLLLACGVSLALTAGAASMRQVDQPAATPERFVDPDPAPARAAVERLVEEGRRFEARDERDRALARYAAALTLDPDDDQARESMVRLALKGAEAPDHDSPDADADNRGELIRLRGDIADSRRDRDELRRQLARVEASIDAQNAVIARLNTAMDDRGRAEPIVNRLDRSLSELERRISRFDTEINGLRRDISRVEREVSSLRSRIR